MPIAIAAPIAGPEATMTVQSADWTMSRASAWFMSTPIVTPAAERQLAPVLQDGHGAARDHPHGQHCAGDRAVRRDDGAADDAVGLRQGHRGHQRVELLLILMPCSTLEKLASCDMSCAESIGLVGSWFFICAMSSCRNAL